MAKGWSGSPKHTESYGDGTKMGGRAPAEMGPRIGAGVMGKRTTPEYARNAKGGNGSPAIKGMKTNVGE